MLVEAHRSREGSNFRTYRRGCRKEETLEDVTENKTFALRLNEIDGLSGALMAPQELELKDGRVCWKGRPVSIIFMDFNTDVLLALHRSHDLSPVLQAVQRHIKYIIHVLVANQQHLVFPLASRFMRNNAVNHLRQRQGSLSGKPPNPQQMRTVPVQVHHRLIHPQRFKRTAGRRRIGKPVQKRRNVIWACHRLLIRIVIIEMTVSR